VKKVGGREEVTIFGQVQISERKDYGRSKIPICPKILPKLKIDCVKMAQNEPKLCSMAKIARLRENTKVAQKLRSATSQFSGVGLNTNTNVYGAIILAAAELLT